MKHFLLALLLATCLSSPAALAQRRLPVIPRADVLLTSDANHSPRPAWLSPYRPENYRTDLLDVRTGTTPPYSYREARRVERQHRRRVHRNGRQQLRRLGREHRAHLRQFRELRKLGARSVAPRVKE